VDEAAHESGAGKHLCPKCGSANVKRSQRRGIQEELVLKREGRSPYRCRDCDERFIGRSRHPGSRGHSWASSLRIRDGRKRRRFARWAVTAVLTLLALLMAYFLFGYFTRPAVPVDAVSNDRVLATTSGPA
jgi:predicted RNA-binding Zn-ribbon protein involved in translation (DUF1610 family)